MQTAERVSHLDVSDNYVYQRSVLAYHEAAKIVSGDVLEIGTGEGYGVELIAPIVNKFVSIDKYPTDKIDKSKYSNVEFLIQEIPPFKGIADNSFDFVISFQVIEHIQNDSLYVQEIHRVLKPGGKFICSTPNKKMSLSRNPWHVREYFVEELNQLLLNSFSAVEKLGVFGKGNAEVYYQQNKVAVNKIMKYDIFNLQYRLPRQILQIPYDILNRRNRTKMLTADNTLVSSITTTDFEIKEATDTCLDLYYISVK